MNKKELVAAVAQKKGISLKEAEVALDGVLESITEALHREESVTLIGFGSFSVKKRAARTGYNPSVKEKVLIPAKRVVRFKAGAKLEIDKK
ncbi:HU family DNA-binding protein [Bacteroides congonensis]|uniref:HU family DNA-binding protein n=1 Tax=Bacteroides congonensis TaxID=1871006 RepID=UPI002FD9E5CD